MSGSVGLRTGSNDAHRDNNLAVARAHSCSSAASGPAADLSNHRRRNDEAYASYAAVRPVSADAYLSGAIAKVNGIGTGYDGDSPSSVCHVGLRPDSHVSSWL